MSGTRQALILGGIPIAVSLIYLAVQVAFGEPMGWELAEQGIFGAAGEVLASLTSNVDPAGVVMLFALGLAMGFGMLVILRGARDL